MEEVLALVLAGGASERLSILASERAKPAVPFGGKYRIIDFTLSNCLNSGIQNVAVLTQFNPRSLMQHIGNGKTWDYDRPGHSLIVLQPFVSRTKRSWYRGTADAVYQNLLYISDQPVDEVLILAGDHVYFMRYDELVRYHRKKKAEVTVGLSEVPLADAPRFGIVTVNRQGRVVDFVEKPSKPKSNLVSMGIYVFNKDALIDILEVNARKKGSHDFGHDILPKIISTHKVYGYKHKGYYRDVGTIDSYWKANMDLIADLPDLNLYNLRSQVRTSTQDQNMPPVKLGPKAQVSRSLISDGAIVNGQVVNCIIAPRVYIGEDARICDSIVFQNTTIGKGTVINHCIIDKQVSVGAGSHIGYGNDLTPNQEEPEHLNIGITLVGKRVKTPEGIKIGRNCKIAPRTNSNDFDSDTIPSGGSVRRKTVRRRGL